MAKKIGHGFQAAPPATSAVAHPLVHGEPPLSRTIAA